MIWTWFEHNNVTKLDVIWNGERKRMSLCGPVTRLLKPIPFFLEFESKSHVNFWDRTFVLLVDWLIF